MNLAQEIQYYVDYLKEDVISSNEDFNEFQEKELKYLEMKMNFPFVMERNTENRIETLEYVIGLCKQIFELLLNVKPPFAVEISQSNESMETKRMKKIRDFKRTRELESNPSLVNNIELCYLKLKQLLQESEAELELLKLKDTIPKHPAESKDLDTDWRLDLSKPLLSKEGKVLRPFVITTEQQTRKEIQEGVFKQRNLPTMTIEQYMDRELARGNYLSSDTQNSTVQQEEEEESEEDIYKQREWDDFKDNNPRGAGNRKNKG